MDEMNDYGQRLRLPSVKKSKMDLKYDIFLKRTVGVYLPECLRHVTEVRPSDPIDVIAHCLYKCVDNNHYRQEKVKYLKDLEKANIHLRQTRRTVLTRLQPIMDAAKQQENILRRLRIEEFNDILFVLQNSDDPIDDQLRSRLHFLANQFNAQKAIRDILSTRAKRLDQLQRSADLRKESYSLPRLDKDKKNFVVPDDGSTDDKYNVDWDALMKESSSTLQPLTMITENDDDENSVMSGNMRRDGA
ncbi:unnamed protein product [Lymnaea stagnalis]|uniref:Uncharacterized protein n=1 Tax=Lymnaea stagnalis TaxID=6523 RepID=A0AAV2IPK3_LYMST